MVNFNLYLNKAQCTTGHTATTVQEFWKSPI